MKKIKNNYHNSEINNNYELILKIFILNNFKLKIFKNTF